MDPLTVGIVASLIVHGAMLAVRFTAADPNRFLPAESQLEVVLLNASTQAKPVKAEVLAQVNSEAGGDHDKGRARSPLPASAQNRDGDTLQAQQARIQQLEAEQQRLLALNNDNESTPQSRPQPDAKTADRSEQEALKQQIARMQAQIDRQLEDYAKRPKRLTYGVNATGVNYARYVNAWADRIEKIGTERFPEEARGKMYDALTVTVELDKCGGRADQQEIPLRRAQPQGEGNRAGRRPVRRIHRRHAQGRRYPADRPHLDLHQRQPADRVGQTEQVSGACTGISGFWPGPARKCAGP